MKNVYIAMIVAGFAVLGGITAVSSLQDSTSGLSTEKAFAIGHVELMVMDEFGNVKQYVQSDNIVVAAGISATSDLVLGTTITANEGLFNSVVVGTDTDAEGSGIGLDDFVRRSNILLDEDATIDASGSIGGIIIALWDGDNDNGRGDDLNNQTGSISIEQVGLTTGGCTQTACPATVNNTSADLFSYQQSAVSVTIGQQDTLQVTWTITFADDGA
ncbi:MAG: hypothetical protein O6761_07700 [Thaumarchaeota archaeon]|nr:hypothetical protein [Nitrososphaerota archaeon]